MRTLSIAQAKARFSRLIDQVAQGETVVITRAGHPVARLGSIASPPHRAIRRIGFLEGEMTVPADFDRMGDEGIAHAFMGLPRTL